MICLVGCMMRVGGVMGRVLGGGGCDKKLDKVRGLFLKWDGDF